MNRIKRLAARRNYELIESKGNKNRCGRSVGHKDIRDVSAIVAYDRRSMSQHDEIPLDRQVWNLSFSSCNKRNDSEYFIQVRFQMKENRDYHSGAIFQWQRLSPTTKSNRTITSQAGIFFHISWSRLYSRVLIAKLVCTSIKPFLLI
jgi:hypothetical protein